jgi:iron-sulfur cluster repair protein YtfE (RIC family)
MQKRLISGASTLNEVIGCIPQSFAIFEALGMGACCDGSRTVAEAAAHHNLNYRTLLDRVTSAENVGRME